MHISHMTILLYRVCREHDRVSLSIVRVTGKYIVLCPNTTLNNRVFVCTRDSRSPAAVSMGNTTRECITPSRTTVFISPQ